VEKKDKNMLFRISNGTCIKGILGFVCLFCFTSVYLLLWVYMTSNDIPYGRTMKQDRYGRKRRPDPCYWAIL